MEYMKEGVWFIGVFNDADTPQTVGFIANHHGMSTLTTAKLPTKGKYPAPVTRGGFYS